MPIYAYRCPSCGKDFEKLISLSRRDEAVKCELCGHEKVKRSVASFAPAKGTLSRDGGFSGGCGSGGFT